MPQDVTFALLARVLRLRLGMVEQALESLKKGSTLRQEMLWLAGAEISERLCWGFSHLTHLRLKYNQVAALKN